MFVFSLDKYLKVELLDHIVVSSLVFREAFILLSTVAAPLCPQQCTGFSFLHILPNTCYFLRILFIYFLEKGKGREKKRERERNMDQLPLTCLQPGTWPTNLACALIGNRTSILLVCRVTLNPVSYTSQGNTC